MQEWHPINPMHFPKQTKLMINSNVNKKNKLVSAFDFCSVPVTGSTESAWGLNGAFTHVR